MEKIAFIGLGIMGRPMATNLLQAGHELFVYARRPEAMQPLTDLGAHACDSAAQAASHASFHITMVSDTSDVEEVILGENGVAEGAAPGGIVMDMSTISLEKTKEIAAQLAGKGLKMLDAPVSGGEQGAIDGTLSIMVGGGEEAFAQALPLFKLMGDNIVHIGGSGSGQIAKASNQILVAQTIIAAAEALEFAKLAGADPKRVRKALLGGFANSRILEVHGLRMLDENYQPGFKARLHLKDLSIASNTASLMGIGLDGLQLSRKYLEKLVDSGGANLDTAAIVEVVRQKLLDPDNSTPE